MPLHFIRILLPPTSRRRFSPTVLLTGLVAAALLVALRLPLAGASVVGSRHDLSTVGIDPGSDQPCAFCHTPHSANVDGRLAYAPLWNRHVDFTKTFTVYGSATMNTTPGDPRTSPSILCLGCHDGTLGTAVVNGYAGSDKHDLVNAPGPGGIPDTSSYPNCRGCHPTIYGDPANEWPGQDLTNDHPIVITYPTVAQDAAFNTPPDPQSGWTDVPLWNGRVECASCHDVHDPRYTPFLRIQNTSSALCLRCHVK